jgi:glyoxylase-like metal-dependent hydrolase (beta-lactamase superfamily II)
VIVIGNKFCLIDPSVDYYYASSMISELEGKVPELVLLTHAHIDHMWGIDSYVSRGAKVIVSEEDAKMLRDKNMNCASFIRGSIDSYLGEYSTVKDGDVIHFEDICFKVMSTPGHTGGSVCYISDNFAFTGDTLFAEGMYGRCDLPSGDSNELSRSLSKLLSCDKKLIIYPGHGRSSTISETGQYLL